jgi:hypothetical protein
MGWWSYFTNGCDCTQDEICVMTDKLKILSYGFGERLIKIDTAREKRQNELESIENTNKQESTENTNKQESTDDTNEQKSTDSANENITIDNTSTNEKKSKPNKNTEINVETTDEEELEYLQKNEKNHSKKDEIYSDEENIILKQNDLDPDEQNNRSWWNKRYEIEQYVKENIKDLSRATFLVSGIAWELFERSPTYSPDKTQNSKLPDDFPEDLRKIALESVKAYYEEMKIRLMADRTICTDGDKCLAALQEEIDVFSRKIY